MHRAADLERDLQVVGIARVDRDPDHPHREAHVDDPGRQVDFELLPGPSGIAAAEHGVGLGADVKGVGIRRIGADRPDDTVFGRRSVGQGPCLPCLAAIARPVGTMLGSGPDGIVVPGIDHQGPHLDAVGQAGAQRCPAAGGGVKPEEAVGA